MVIKRCSDIIGHRCWTWCRPPCRRIRRAPEIQKENKLTPTLEHQKVSSVVLINAALIQLLFRYCAIEAKIEVGRICINKVHGTVSVGQEGYIRPVHQVGRCLDGVVVWLPGKGIYE